MMDPDGSIYRDMCGHGGAYLKAFNNTQLGGIILRIETFDKYRLARYRYTVAWVEADDRWQRHRDILPALKDVHDFLLWRSKLEPDSYSHAGNFHQVNIAWTLWCQQLDYEPLVVRMVRRHRHAPSRQPRG